MAKNTSILLGDYFDNFINQQIKTGKFSSASEVVRAALRMFEHEETLIFIFLAFFLPFVPEVIKNGLDTVLMGVFVPLVIVFGFIVYMLFKTEYIIEKNQLKIRMRPFSYKSVDINKMKDISKTRSVLSSPAASFDRIKIKYGKYEEVIISPKDKSNFIADLTSINPNIKINI